MISAFFASYSDQWDQSSASMMLGKMLLALTGGMFVLAYAISRKVDKMVPSVAVATLIAYASLQGIVFGLSYREVYDAPLAPVYLCMCILFGLLACYGRYSGIDLTSVHGFLIGTLLAPVLAFILKGVFGMQIVSTLAVCVCSWLMLAIAGYHRQFLRDLPSSFDDDSQWLKAASAALAGTGLVFPDDPATLTNIWKHVRAETRQIWQHLIGGRRWSQKEALESLSSEKTNPVSTNLGYNCPARIRHNL